MSDFTRVSAAGMTQGIESLQRANQQLQTTLEDLKGKLRNSLAQWEGEATDAYNQVQARWDQQAIEMNGIVQQMGQILNQINEAYIANESSVRSRWS